jgi:N6-L-threonylcarbamoyladenine synthase
MAKRGFFIEDRQTACKGVRDPEKMSLICLGIETSCDETSAAIVKDGSKILSSVVFSQVDLHSIFGGVVPEIASRAHIKTILPVIDKTLTDAGLTLDDINAIAVTNKPGLIGALLVGVCIAKAIAISRSLPLIAVDHIHAHIYATNLEFPDIKFPFISMVVSGGHTSIYLSKTEISHELLGATRDDAAGEAFDKVAKILGLGFPGGPIIDKISRDKDPEKVHFYRPMIDEDTLDFSFSGIKTAVLYRVKGQNIRYPDAKLSDEQKADIAAGFQEAVVDTLVNKGIRACKKTGIFRISITGGVACNSRLREKFQKKAKENDIAIYFPSPQLCTDNAAMVAGIAYHLYKEGRLSDLSLDAIPTKIYRS